MLISKKNNKGFSLVEVIVSMLVLSIVISSVLTAFSLSAKSNAKTQKAQSAESLMEDLQELAGAVQDSSRFVGTCETMFHVVAPTPQVLSSTQSLYKLTGISKGSFSYDVDITIDTEPSDYEDMNDIEVLTFGESGKATILIDASENGNKLYGYSENWCDAMAVNRFITLRNDKINADNALLAEGETPTEPLNPDDATDKQTVRVLIDRDVYLEVIETPTGKVQLTGYFSYQLGGDDTSFDIGGASRIWEYPFFPAQEFSKPGTGTEGDEELGRIYLLFSPFVSENRTATGNYDVRIWDDTQRLLDTDIFIVYQESSIQSIDPSSPGGTALLGQSLAERYPETDVTKKVDVSFAKRGELAEKPPHDPNCVNLYSPAKIVCGSFATVNAHSNQMIPQDQEIRVHTITIEIKDSDGVVLATDTVTSLQ